MTKLHFAVVLTLLGIHHTSLTETKKYFAGNLPPIKFYSVNNFQDLLNGGPLNLNDAKFISGNTTSSNLKDENPQISDESRVEETNLNEQSAADDDVEAATNEADSNATILAVGSNFSDLAVLVPANLSVLQKSNIHPQHIIGYVPLNSPNGQALVLPAGAVRIANNIKDNKLLDNNFNVNNINENYEENDRMEMKAVNEITEEDDDDDDDPKPEGRGVRRRKRIRRRNSKSRLRRNRRRRNRNSTSRNRRRSNRKRLNRRQNNRNNKSRKVRNRRKSNSRRKNSRRRKSNSRRRNYRN